MKRNITLKKYVIWLVGFFALLLWAGPSLAERQVVVGPGGVSPERVVISKGEEVAWANATGGLIHIEFETQPGGHLFQLAKGEAFRVRFDQPGEHKYFVHIAAAKPHLLSGVVVVK